jgi:hypothetical protein
MTLEDLKKRATASELTLIEEVLKLSFPEAKAQIIERLQPYLTRRVSEARGGYGHPGLLDFLKEFGDELRKL